MWLYQFAFQPTVQEGSLFFILSPTFIACRFFDDSHSEWCEVMLLFSWAVVSDSCNPMNCSMPGITVLRYLLDFAQTHVHWFSDAIQPSHCLSSSSPPALNLSQHLGLFAPGGRSIGASASASVLPVNIQGWFPLGLTGLISLLTKELSRVFPSTTASILRHSAFLMVQLSHSYMTTGKTIALTIWTFVSKVISRIFFLKSHSHHITPQLKIWFQ